MSHTKSDNSVEGAPFVVKTYQLVTDPGTNGIVSWSDNHDSFVVWKPVDFAAEVLPQYFKHNNFCSFIRQLNTYGFHKVEGKQWEFRHDQFRSGKPQLLKDIQRRKSKKRGNEKEDDADHDKTPAMPVGTPASQNLPIAVDATPHTVYIKTEKPEKAEELEKLRDLNQLLMREVIRLQQQQDNAQDTINRILDQLVESRKETHSLHKKIARFTNEVSNQLPGSISLISPPASPARPEISDYDKYLFAAPTFTPNKVDPVVPSTPVVPPGPSAVFKGEIFDMNTLDSLLNDESYVNVSDLNLDQELAKMLQHTLSPPQSPAHY